ncbi:MAG: C4-dicarboxylate ABC transporter, partial [Magnetospirillum sp.]|nr:C4-dicarboxylate ABC transporter [Magnetospirillum sp.]
DECNSMPIAIKAKTMDAYLKRNGWLSRTVIRRGTYEGPTDDIPSLQLRAVLTTTTRLPADEVYDVVKAVYANFPAFTRLHPVLKGLAKAETGKDGIAIKLHDGAEKFYGETGVAK